MSEREGVRGLDAVREVLAEMRERKINHGRDTSPTLVAWADRIERAITTPPAGAEQRARELLRLHAVGGKARTFLPDTDVVVKDGALRAIASAMSHQPEARGVVRHDLCGCPNGRAEHSPSCAALTEARNVR